MFVAVLSETWDLRAVMTPPTPIPCPREQVFEVQMNRIEALRGYVDFAETIAL